MSRRKRKRKSETYADLLAHEEAHIDELLDRLGRTARALDRARARRKRFAASAAVEAAQLTASQLSAEAAVEADLASRGEEYLKPAHKRRRR